MAKSCDGLFSFCLLQMLFLATFFPTWEGGAGAYDFVGVSVAVGKQGRV